MNQAVASDPEPVRYEPNPRPCPRCAHREDVHEVLRGMRYCRWCNWIGAVYPCSMRTMAIEQQLDKLSFDLDG